MKKPVTLKSKDVFVSVTGPLPVTKDSYPYNAANRQYRPIDLRVYEYVEEEFQVSGLANIYQWYHGGIGPAKVRTPDAPPI